MTAPPAAMVTHGLVRRHAAHAVELEIGLVRRELHVRSAGRARGWGAVARRCAVTRRWSGRLRVVLLRGSAGWWRRRRVVRRLTRRRRGLRGSSFYAGKRRDGQCENEQPSQDTLR